MHGILSTLPSRLHSHFCPPSIAPVPVGESENIKVPPLPLIGNHLRLIELYAQQPIEQKKQQEPPCFRIIVAKLPQKITRLQLLEPLQKVFPNCVNSATIPLSKRGKRTRNFALIDMNYRVDLSKVREAYKRANLPVKLKTVDVKEFM